MSGPRHPTVTKIGTRIKDRTGKDRRLREEMILPQQKLSRVKGCPLTIFLGVDVVTGGGQVLDFDVPALGKKRVRSCILMFYNSVPSSICLC